jgi:hypothetical protein
MHEVQGSRDLDSKAGWTSICLKLSSLNFNLVNASILYSSTQIEDAKNIESLLSIKIVFIILTQ